MPYLLGAPFIVGYRDIAASLFGLRWRLPKIADNGLGGWTCPATDSQSAVMGGLPGTSWDITCRFRGVIENKTYIGGSHSADGWQVGGTPDTTGPAALWNVYSLAIGSPAQQFYLNYGTSFLVYQIDFTKVIQIDAGSLITLFADSVDNNEGAHSISVSGVTDPSQPFAGQWVNMEVTSIDPH
jgi:hypothetical protein